MKNSVNTPTFVIVYFQLRQNILPAPSKYTSRFLAILAYDCKLTEIPPSKKSVGFLIPNIFLRPPSFLALLAVHG